uniref:Uncharacterized protein n=1 Tax=Timema cristinae TaxID=61476 RepID=A0A7R9D251_TIMCR|nr:unnamed protein product [Timema cristinae]
MKEDQEETDDMMFEQIMNKIGSRGKFQKRFNYLFNMFFVMLASMPYYNFVLAMAVPDHWCHVPGRNGTNYTLDQWKEITLPREKDTAGLLSFSKCKMYVGKDWADVTSSGLTPTDHGLQKHDVTSK